MKNIAYAIIIAVGVAAVVMWQTQRLSETELSIGDVTFTALVADEAHEQVAGLGGRASLSPDTAMLFIFPMSDRYGIWMKDMQFPIDIVWLDDEKQIVDIKENVAPDTYPEVFYPNTKSRYVIEFPAGSAQELRLHVGTRADFAH